MLRQSILVPLVYLGGLATVVPYSVWYVLYRAPREDYAFWIMLAVGWTVFYFPLVLPSIAVARLVGVLRNLDRYRSIDDVIRATGMTQEELAVQIARENGIPRFLARPVARRIWELVRPGSRSGERRRF